MATKLRTQTAYDIIHSPIGPLFAAVGPRGLCSLTFGLDFGVFPDNVDPGAGHDTVRLARVRRSIRDYFDGDARAFEGLPVDLTGMTAFSRDVLAATADIPFGATMTYGEVARAIGRPEAARAVGGALNRNPVCIVVPCHRVVGSSGALVGFGGGLPRKEWLLAHERAFGR